MSRLLTHALPLTALTVLSFAPLCAQAQIVVHNNFGAGDTFDPGGYVEGSRSSIGVGFTPSVSGALFDITIALSHSSGTNDAHVFLSNGTSGIPGTVLETFTLTNLPGFNGRAYTPETLTSTLRPLLTAGTTYYLYEQETGNENNGFNLNITGETGIIFSTDNKNYSSNSAPSGAYRVRVTAVPEPGSLALLAGITMTGAGFLRRRKTAAKAA